MLRSKSILLLFSILLSISIIGNSQSYQIITLDSNFEYNLSVGDVIGIFINETHDEVTYGDENETYSDETIAYLRYQCSEYEPNTLVNGSLYTIVGLSSDIHEYSPISQPSFITNVGWTPDEDIIHYVNESLGSMFDLSRIIIPKDIDLLDYFSDNATNFIYTLMLFIAGGNSPVDQFRSLINQTESETETSNITFTNNNKKVNLTWEFDLIGYKYPAPPVNLTIRNFMSVDFIYETNDKRVCEELSVNIHRNTTIWSNISGFVRNTIDNQKIYNKLMYDSDPFSFWDIYGYTWLIIVGAVGIGLIAFFSFYWSKCSVNPSYSKVCKVYGKSIQKTTKKTIKRVKKSTKPVK